MDGRFLPLDGLEKAADWLSSFKLQCGRQVPAVRWVVEAERGRQGGIGFNVDGRFLPLDGRHM